MGRQVEWHGARNRIALADGDLAMLRKRRGQL